MPVTKRSSGATRDAGSTTSSSAFGDRAAQRARGEQAARIDAIGQPEERAHEAAERRSPACTPLVSAACAKPVSPYSATSAGTTADAENHSAIAATWQSAMIVTDASLVWACTLRL